LARCGHGNYGNQAMSKFDHPLYGAQGAPRIRTMSRFHYSIKRKVMRIRCLFGKHDHKMGAPAKGGGGFGCLWCRKPLSDIRMLKDADRQIRRMFGGKT
jgi:hypothetical protein